MPSPTSLPPSIFGKRAIVDLTQPKVQSFIIIIVIVCLLYEVFYEALFVNFPILNIFRWLMMCSIIIYREGLDLTLSTGKDFPMHSLGKDWWWIEWPYSTKTRELLGDPNEFPNTSLVLMGHGHSQSYLRDWIDQDWMDLRPLQLQEHSRAVLKNVALKSKLVDAIWRTVP